MTLSLLGCGAGVLEQLRISSTRFSPEVFRAWGWYVYADSSKVQRELGYRLRKELWCFTGNRISLGFEYE